MPSSCPRAPSPPPMTDAVWPCHLIGPSFTGPTNKKLRVHLPLLTPGSGLARLRVGSQVKEARPGRALVFDDSFEHEAWNDDVALEVGTGVSCQRVVGPDGGAGGREKERCSASDADGVVEVEAGGMGRGCLERGPRDDRVGDGTVGDRGRPSPGPTDGGALDTEEEAAGVNRSRGERCGDPTESGGAEGGQDAPCPSPRINLIADVWHPDLSRG